MWVVVFAVIVVVAVLVLFQGLLSSRARAFGGYPGPHPLPVIGNALPLLFKGAHLYLEDLAVQYGDLFVVWIGLRPFVVISDPDMIKEVLQSKNGAFKKGAFADIMKPLLGVGLLTSEGETWRLHRKLANSSFQASRYKNSIDRMGERVQVLMRNWRKKYVMEGETSSSFELCTEMSRLTLDNIGIASFGGHFDALDSQSTCLYDSVAIVLREMQQRAEQLYPVHQYYPSWMQRGYLNAVSKIKEIVHIKISERKALLQSEDKSDKRQYLLDMLLESQEEYKLSDEEIVDEMVTWVMGGHETTASLLSWTFYLLDKYPLAQQKVMQELSTVMKDTSVAPSYEEIQNMEYLTMVLKETLRLYPPAPLLNRTTIEGVEIGEYLIPANTEVLVCPWGLQRSSKYWSDPDEFLPERWKENDHNAFNFVAFSGGPRACLGKMFAFMEAKLIVSMILNQFQVHIAQPEKVETEVAITLRAKHGIYCSVNERTNVQQAT